MRQWLSSLFESRWDMNLTVILSELVSDCGSSLKTGDGSVAMQATAVSDGDDRVSGQGSD